MDGTITALKVQKRNKDRVSVYLDGEYAFGVKAIVAARLRVGQSLSDDDIVELQGRDLFERAYDRALDFLSYRPRSEAEVRRYLRDKQMPEQVIEATIERLTRVDLLDDEAFARFWIENREQFKPRSRRMLSYELRQKGVAAATIARMLDDVDEQESAYRAAAQQIRRYAKLDREAFFRRLMGFLGRRGFDYQVAMAVVRRLWEERESGCRSESNELER